MTPTETVLAELNTDIQRALADWEGCFSPVTRDAMQTIMAGERMAGVLTRVKVLSDMLIETQTKRSNVQV